MKRFILTGILGLVLGLFAGCASRSTGFSKPVQKQVAHIERFRRESLRNHPPIRTEAEQRFARTPLIHPDALYAQQYDSLAPYFMGEVGFDTYCVWYAAFARTRHRGSAFRQERDTLYEIFYSINDLLKNLSGNGTIFLHASYRIPAYTEYYLDRFRQSSPDTRQDTVLQDTRTSLRQLCEFYRFEEDSEQAPLARQIDMNKRLASIEALLTNQKYRYALLEYIRSLETIAETSDGTVEGSPHAPEPNTETEPVIETDEQTL